MHSAQTLCGGWTPSQAAAAPAGAQRAPVERPPDPDQAATLRRLFARPRSRVLPVLLPQLHCALRSAWVARLAQCCVRLGQRTLVVDAARAQIAAALGLRARFDLAHALRGECTPQAALLDAGDGLTVLPAARAAAGGALAGRSVRAALDVPWSGRGEALLPQVAQLGRHLIAGGGCDLVLLATSAPGGCAGDVLVPATASAAELARTASDIARGLRAAPSEADLRATPVFRLLFLDMDAGAAATLTEALALRLSRLRRSARIELAGAACAPRDLEPVVRASAGWSLAALEWMQ